MRKSGNAVFVNIDPDRLAAAWTTARADLLAECDTPCAGGGHHWTGALSTSALSTATAVSALSIFQSHLSNDDVQPWFTAGRAPRYEQLERIISNGLNWLADHQNADGGWGDTDRSHSNIATTMLVRAAFQLNGVPVDHSDLAERADAYIRRLGGIGGLRRRYGRDKTFAIPILANCALAGMVDWKDVSPLPFELACLPQSWYRFLRLPVVSYAIPALVAVGQARYFFKPPLNPLARLLRRKAVEPSLDVLRKTQPDSGGYLEAVPLTSFVVMCLAGIGRFDHPVAQHGVRFLLDGVRPDGSWPIDTNLATWTTTLSVNALSAGGDDLSELDCRDWILACQHRQRHPFTGAEPGGWAWTDLSGGVPDADDTAGALLALAAFRDGSERPKWDAEEFEPETSSGEQYRGISVPGPDVAISEQSEASLHTKDAVAAGIDWLLGLQNRDGGWPTFCRGWGALPFDRSGADLTAHVVRAMQAWRGRLDETDPSREQRMAEAMRRGMRYLAAKQRPDGSWLPLWFGNQDRPQEENPVFGTSRVLMVFRDLRQLDSPAARRGIAWLCDAQNADGGWGAPLPPAAKKKGLSQQPRFVSSVEETSLALEALLGVPEAAAPAKLQTVLTKGLQWLCDTVEANQHGNCSPIGFYFAKLWYYEKLYPLIFSTAALGTAIERLRRDEQTLLSPAMAARRENRRTSPTTAPSART
ncbi:MAG: prenyltransferase/squalene oxidase repeat-containing protein [Pirellulales bacterium]